MKNHDDLAVRGATPASYGRRSCLKLVSGAAAAMTAAPVTVALAQLETAGAATAQVAPGEIPSQVPPQVRIPDITINININREDLVDWMMIENLHEQPLILKKFAPRWVAYNNSLLDLDAMLSRQQRGRKQLEISPNYAWNHSVRGAVRPLQECFGITADCYDASLAASVAKISNRSLQLPCCVSDQGVVDLLAT